jgi:cysteine desulfurase
VVSITSNFQSEAPLHPAVIDALGAVFGQAWADSAKLPADSRKARLLLDESRETFAKHFGIRSDGVHFLGEVNLGFYLGILGLIQPESTFSYSSIDRSEIFAIAEQLRSQGMQVEELSCDAGGVITSPVPDAKKIVAWQLRNGETGISQPMLADSALQIFVDATSSGLRNPLPKNWRTALWDSKAWGGPSGLGIFAVAPDAKYRNPIPHLDNRIVPGSASLPLIIASAMALELWSEREQAERNHLAALALLISNFAKSEIGDVDVIAATHDLISLSFLYIDAERLVGALDRAGFAVDSGSACQATNMEPSHVLAAMGTLTQGNVRITLHHGVTEKQINELLASLKALVAEQRAN